MEIKMYCKKCGKKIPDSARFCDRCGLPVKNTSQGAEAREKKRRQLAERNKDSYESYRMRKMQRETERKRLLKRRRTIMAWLIVLAFAASVGLGFYAYYATMKNLNDGEEPTASPVATDTSSPDKDNKDKSDSSGMIEVDEEDDAVENDDESETDTTDSDEISKYNTYESTNDFECIYPSAFTEGGISNNHTVKSLEDPDAEGTMMLINYEQIGKSATAASILSDYKNNNSVSNDEGEPEMMTDGNFYSITYIRNGQKRHRCGIILDNTKHVYYDFSHDNLSEYSNDYAEYIDDIDQFLKKQSKKK